MAMRPKDRYQFVADFSNDLKHVLDLITSEARSTPNPFSTQPDLPKLYEAMQNAKMAENMDIQNVSQPQRSAYSVASHCPQCNASLMANAPFCPNCGIPLTASPKSVGDIHTPDSMPSTGKSSAQQGYVRAVDQVVTTSSQKPHTPRASTPAPTSTPQAFSENTASAASPSAWNSTPITPQGPSSSPKTTSSTSSKQVMQQQKPSGFTISTGLVIVVLIILIILIIIMIVLIITHIQHATGQIPYNVFTLLS